MFLDPPFRLESLSRRPGRGIANPLFSTPRPPRPVITVPGSPFRFPSASLQLSESPQTLWRRSRSFSSFFVTGLRVDFRCFSPARLFSLCFSGPIMYLLPSAFCRKLAFETNSFVDGNALPLPGDCASQGMLRSFFSEPCNLFSSSSDSTPQFASLINFVRFNFFLFRVRLVGGLPIDWGDRPSLRIVFHSLSPPPPKTTKKKKPPPSHLSLVLFCCWLRSRAVYRAYMYPTLSGRGTSRVFCAGGRHRFSFTLPSIYPPPARTKFLRSSFAISTLDDSCGWTFSAEVPRPPFLNPRIVWRIRPPPSFG